MQIFYLVPSTSATPVPSTGAADLPIITNGNSIIGVDDSINGIISA